MTPAFRLLKFFPLSLRTAFAVLFLGALPHAVTAQDDGDQGSDDNGTSFQTFYDQLNDQGGQWIQTGDYGYVWQPPVQDPDWRPYSEGHWVDTDYGWTWVSDEPWGWATYHYGRWANLDGEGWVWVPGYRWAPAWVSWRYGGGYAGWAPLPPESFVGVDYARPGFSLNADFHIGGDVDVAFHIGAGCYNFVPVEHLCEPRLHGYYVPRNNNYGVINRTTNITNVYVNKTVVNNYYNNSTHNQTTNNFGGVTTSGPNVAAVNSVSRTHLQHVTLAQSNQPGTTSQEGNTVHIFAPQVSAASFRTAKPSHVDRTLTTVQVNRGDSIDRPQQTTARIKPSPPTQEQVQQARQAQNNAPSSARIATPRTEQKVHLSQPLTHLQTAADFHKLSSPSSTSQPPASSNHGEQTHAASTSSSANHPPTEKPASPGENTPVVPQHHSDTTPVAQESNSTHTSDSTFTPYHPAQPQSAAPQHHDFSPQHSSSASSASNHPASSTPHPANLTSHPAGTHPANAQSGNGGQGQHADKRNDSQNNPPNGH